MNPSDLTRWGARLLYVRGLCGGVFLSAVVAPSPNPWLMLAALLVVGLSGVATPILRALGWRRLAERVQDVPTGPFRDEVKIALRTALGSGMDLQEAVKFLRGATGWDVLQLYPVVAEVAGIPEKEAIRLVVSTV
ncbi:hypothetical protein R5W24_000749 [Gemmata sp. JC717]|uniref:Uncharacterized protein n=1 Tax=Gemmata algarum TaxID=2975278 RepID=A0ABU5F5T6_9BACT|nr:hypothetical protein [Gemmata algarum]MDY3551670.1 hypothetical protein [Gemmata algarum]MDY3562095.1 hypothetical protein [Gemmata algarum]